MKSDAVCYVLPEDVAAQSLFLRKEEAHHLVAVLRKQVNDHFTAVDGRGTAFECQITSHNSTGLQARIFKKIRFWGEPLFRLTLAVAVTKRNPLEWIVEKATELGVVGFIPLLTQRTLAKPVQVKPKRLRKIALSAMKQCQRSWLPEIAEAIPFADFCQQAAAYDFKLIAHEKGEQPTPDAAIRTGLGSQSAASPKRGILCVGPEGGFTADEIATAMHHGLAPVTLGPRRLRVETAAFVGATLIMHRMGELK